jgi:MFS family permease
MPNSTCKFISRLAIPLVAITAALAAMHCLVHSLVWRPEMLFIVRMWDMDTEANVPTWFAGLLWFFVSALAASCFVLERKLDHRRNLLSFIWLIISAAFLVASCDEIATIHEEIGTFLHKKVYTWSQTPSPDAFPPTEVIQWLQSHQGAPDSPWLMFYTPILAAFGCFSIYFLYQRLRKEKILLALCFSTPLCFAVALVMDYFQGMPENREVEISRQLHMTNEQALNVSIVIEETLEDIGCIALILSFGGYCRILLTEWDEERMGARQSSVVSTAQASEDSASTTAH